MPTKKVFIIFIASGAVLLAGLSLFSVNKESVVSSMKPSQLNFTQSNKVQESTALKNNSSPEAEVLSSTSTNIGPLSDTEQKLWANFEEILSTKNDSDSRVDKLKKLSPEFHKELHKKYSLIKPEDRSGRGMIVFLIARDLQSASDLEFLQSIYQESPCLSLENCAIASSDNDPHHSNVNQTTLIYPQLVALFQIEKHLEANPKILDDAEMRAGFLTTLKQAETFPVPSVRDRAEKIRQKYQL